MKRLAGRHMRRVIRLTEGCKTHDFLDHYKLIFFSVLWPRMSMRDCEDGLASLSMGHEFCSHFE